MCNIKIIIYKINNLLNKEVTVQEFINEIDSLVSNNILFELEDEISAIIDDYHDNFALYVKDRRARKELPGVYLSECDIREKALELKNILEEKLIKRGQILS